MFLVFLITLLENTQYSSAYMLSAATALLTDMFSVWKVKEV